MANQQSENGNLTVKKLVESMKKLTKNGEENIDLSVDDLYIAVHSKNKKEGSNWVADWEQVPSIYLKVGKQDARLNMHAAWELTKFFDKIKDEIHTYAVMYKKELMKKMADL